jgi:hypothetical protein
LAGRAALRRAGRALGAIAMRSGMSGRLIMRPGFHNPRNGETRDHRTRLRA